MNIIVFGAAFDPPHNGHQLMVETVLKLGLADGVWLLPAKRHPFSKQLTPASHRLAMLQLFIANLNDSRVRVEEYELHQDSTSFTYKTLQALKVANPSIKFSFLIGSDNLAQFEHWDQYEAMLQQFTFYVYPRLHYPIEPLYKGMIHLANVKQVDTSSTQVRNLIIQEKSAANLVLPEIANYIRANNLYVK